MSASDKAKQLAKAAALAAAAKARKAAAEKHIAGSKALSDGERKKFTGRHKKAFVGGW